MSLKDLTTVIDGPEWGGFSLDDQLDILSGGFSAEIAGEKDDKVKEEIYKDFQASRTLVAANKAKERLGDDAPMKIKAYEEFLRTEDGLARENEMPAMSDGKARIDYDPALAIRQVESVEALTGQKLGGKELREEFNRLGPEGIDRDRVTTALSNPTFLGARDAARKENVDVQAFFDFTRATNETEFKPFMVDAKNPDGLVQIRKKPEPGSTYEVKFPDGKVEGFKFGKEQYDFRAPNLGERAVGGFAAGLKTTLSNPAYAMNPTRIFKAFGEGTHPHQRAAGAFSDTTPTPEKTGETVFDPRDLGVPTQGQLLDFIGLRADLLGPEKKKDFEEQRGSLDVGNFRAIAFSAPLRGALVQPAEGIAGTVDMVRRGLGGSEDTMAAKFAEGGRRAAKLVRRNLAPKSADAGVIGESLFTISEAGSGLLADLLVAKGVGRMARIEGLSAPAVGQAAKAGFTASASTKVVGSTYDEAFRAHREKGDVSFEGAHNKAATEAATVGLFTAALERAGPANFFLSPKQATTAASVIRKGMKGGVIEGLGEEVPQAVFSVAMKDLFRDDGSVDEEVKNLRQALGRGNLEAFKNSEVLQGLVGGFGAGAAVGTAQAAAGRASPPALPQSTVDLTDEQVQQVANENFVRQATSGVLGTDGKPISTEAPVLPPPAGFDGNQSAGEARLAAIAAAPDTDAGLTPEALAAATPQVGDVVDPPTPPTTDESNTPTPSVVEQPPAAPAAAPVPRPVEQAVEPEPAVAPREEAPALYHGSSGEFETLRAGSMLTNKPEWSAGYTTKLNVDGSEDFVGKVHGVRFQPANPILVEGYDVQKAESELVRRAKALGDSGGLRSAAKTVFDATGHDAVVVMKNGELQGMIPLIDVGVSEKLDPVDVLSKADFDRLPENMQKALTRNKLNAPTPPSPAAATPTPASLPKTSESERQAPLPRTDATQKAKPPTDRQLLAEALPALKNAKLGNNIRVTGKPLSKGQKSAKAISEFFGRRAVFLSGFKPNGANLRSMPGSVFIAENSTRAEVLVAVHELTHSFAATDPEGYQKLKDAVDVDLDAYVAAHPTRKGATREETHEEFLGDFLADRITDPAFWEGMAAKDRTLFDKVVEALRDIIAKVKEGRLGTEKFVANLDAADAAIKVALKALKAQSPQFAQAPRAPSGDVRTETNEETAARDADTARFNELTADLDPQDIRGWKASHPEELAELTAMRERVLRAAGYETGPVIHQTNAANFTEFDITRARNSGRSRIGFFFTDNPDVEYGRSTLTAFLESNEPLTFPSFGGFDAWAARNEVTFGDTSSLRDVLRKDGYDSIEIEGETDGFKQTITIVLDPAQIKSADPLALDADGKLITPDQWGDSGSPDIRFEQREGNPIQTANEDNAYYDREPTHVGLLRKASQSFFNPAAVPRNEEGYKTATRFLGTLSTVKRAQDMKNAARRAGVRESDLHLIAGVARARVMSFAADLALTDPVLAQALKMKVQKSATTLGFLFDGNKLQNASIMGKTLAALRSEKSSILGLFDHVADGMKTFVKRNVGIKGVADDAQAITDAEVADTDTAEDLADAISLGPETAERIARAEEAARTAWDQVIDLLLSLTPAARKDVFSELREGMTPDDLRSLLASYRGNKDAPLEDIQAATEQYIKAVKADLDAATQSAVRRARKTTKRATDASEEATGTTDTKNQVDIMGKRKIGLVNRGKNEVAEKTAALKKEFDALMVAGRDKDAFVEAYVKLGGTEAVGAEVFEANVVLKDRQLTKAAEIERRQAAATAQRKFDNAKARRQAAIDKAQEFIGTINDPKSQPRRPTAQSESYRQVINRYTNPNNARMPQDAFARQLSEFVNADGQPTFTAEQVQEIVARADVARAAATEAKGEAAKERFRKALERRDTARVNSAENLFAARAPQQKDLTKRSLRQIILEDFINNPERRILNQAERIEFAEEILREKTDLTEAEIPVVARRMEGQLAQAISKEKMKAAEPLFKKISTGENLTLEQIQKAVRLEVLDPSSDFITSLAALSGWQGLTSAEVNKLSELQRASDIAGPGSATEQINTRKMARIIKASTGIPPGWAAWVNAFLRALVFSGTATHILGHAVGAGLSTSALAWDSGITAKRAIGRPLSDTFAEFAELYRNWGFNYKQGADAYINAIKTGASYTEQVLAGQEEGKGVQFVDALTRSYDYHTKRLTESLKDLEKETRSGKRAGIKAKRVWSRFVAYVATAPRFNFNLLTAADAGFSKQISSTRTSIKSYRMARDTGMTRAEFKALEQAAREMAERHHNYLIETLGMVEGSRMLRVSTRDRFETALMQQLYVNDVDTQGLREATILDIQAKMGLGQTSDTLIGKFNQVTTGGVKAAEGKDGRGVPLAGIFLAVRTPFNAMDEAVWVMPGFNLPRFFHLNPKGEGKMFTRKTFEEASAAFPHIKQEWQLNERKAAAAFAYVLLPMVLAMFKFNDEEDEEAFFRFTGPEPEYGTPRWHKWQKRGWTPNTLIVKGIPTPVKLDRGFMQVLLPIMHGAMILKQNLTNGPSEAQFARQINMLAETYVPGLTHIVGLGQQYTRTNPETGEKGGVMKIINNQKNMVIPSFARTGRRLGPAVDVRQSRDAPLSALNPFYADFDDARVIQVRNALGEPLTRDANPYGWIEKLGFPIFVRIEGKRDPRKVEMFEHFDANGYLPKPYTVDQFKERIKDSNVNYSAELFREWQAFEIEYLVNNYDLGGDEENYSNKMGVERKRARDRADRDLGIRRAK